MPSTVVNKVLATMDGKFSKETKEAMTKAATMFVYYVSQEIEEETSRRKRKTAEAKDVETVLAQLGYDLERPVRSRKSKARSKKASGVSSKEQLSLAAGQLTGAAATAGRAGDAAAGGAGGGEQEQAADQAMNSGEQEGKEEMQGEGDGADERAGAAIVPEQEQDEGQDEGLDDEQDDEQDEEQEAE